MTWRPLVTALPVVLLLAGTRAAGREGPGGRQDGFVRAADGTRLYYHQVGSGRPMVIIPAGLFLERDFASLARRHTVVFYDMRGRGRSDPNRRGHRSGSGRAADRGAGNDSARRGNGGASGPAVLEGLWNED